jgi:hypothetical protein
MADIFQRCFKLKGVGKEYDRNHSPFNFKGPFPLVCYEAITITTCVYVCMHVCIQKCFKLAQRN